ILHSDFALARSLRASTKMRSHVGAETRDAGDAGICFVVWLRRDRAGSTSLSTAEVRISSCAMSRSSWWEAASLLRIVSMTDPAAAAREAAVTAWAKVSPIPVWVGALVAVVLIAFLAREQY